MYPSSLTSMQYWILYALDAILMDRDMHRRKITKTSDNFQRL